MMDRNTRHAAASVTVRLVIVLLTLCCAQALAAGDDDPRDFPPLLDPSRPAEPEVAPGELPAEAPPETALQEPPPAFQFGIGDEAQVSVLAAPEFSGMIKVRPDGAISAPGVGTVYALGRSPEDVVREMEEKLGKILRHARVDLVVTNYGPRRFYVMGQVELPGDRPFYEGMSVLEAIATAGGVSYTGQAGSVLVLRRTGTDTIEVRRLDLTRSLQGEPGSNMLLRPFDIVYVPRTLLSRSDLLLSGFVRNLIWPFSLYLEGWKATKTAAGNYKVVLQP